MNKEEDDHVLVGAAMSSIVGLVEKCERKFRDRKSARTGCTRGVLR